MDLVQPWLVATLGTQLGKILEWRASGESIQLPDGEVARSSFEDDGSNLRIKPRRLGQKLQIIKFPGCSEPVKASLSDSIFRINVSIAVTASRKYEREARQRLWQGTLGGVIQLLDFELVATPYGPRSSRLTLFVKDLKLLGSAGSGIKGSPRSIEDSADISVLLEMLSRQSKGQDHPGSQGSSTRQSTPKAPSVLSPSPIDILARETTSEVQASAFATQPHHISANKKAAPLICESDDETITTQTTTVTSNILNAYKHNRQTLHGASNADLLSMFSTIPLDKQSATSITAQRVISADQTQIPSDPDAEAISGKIDTDAASEGLDSLIAPATVTRSQPNRPALGPEEDVAAQNHASPSKPVVTTVLTSLSPNAGSIAPSETLSASSVVKSLTAPSKGSSTAQSIINNQRQGRNRIYLSDIRISKEQDKLLSRSDSWLPPEPGQREPVANVPIKILNALNDHADQRADSDRLLAFRSPSHAFGAAPSEIYSSSNVESEESLPWSPSPGRGLSDSERLPPDSSANHSDHVATIPATCGTPAAFCHSSRPSFEAHFVPSATLKSTFVEKRASPENTDSSLALGTPKSSPITDDNDVRPHHCWGCNESYTDLSLLKDHVRNTHNPQGGFSNAGLLRSTRGGSWAGPPLDAEKSIRTTSEAAPLQLGPTANGSTDHEAAGTAEEALADVIAGPIPDPEVQHSTEKSHDLEASSKVSQEVISSACMITTRAGAAHLSTPASPESKLEITVPRTQGQAELQQDYQSSARYPPSTASQTLIPFTQVRRTPYINGCGRSEAPEKSHNPASSLDNGQDCPSSGISIEASTVASLSELNLPEVLGPAAAVTYDNAGHTSDRSQEHRQDDSAEENGAKRKVSNASKLLAPENKRIKISGFLEEGLMHVAKWVDPDDMARHFRQEFLRSRQNSVSSPTKDSPVTRKVGYVDASSPSSRLAESKELEPSLRHLQSSNVIDNSKVTVRAEKPVLIHSSEDPSNHKTVLNAIPMVEGEGSLAGCDYRAVRAGTCAKPGLLRMDTALPMHPNPTYPSLSDASSNAIYGPTSTEKYTTASSVTDVLGAKFYDSMNGKVKKPQGEIPSPGANNTDASFNRHHFSPLDTTLFKRIIPPPLIDKMELNEGNKHLPVEALTSPESEERTTREQAHEPVHRRANESDLSAENKLLHDFKAEYPEYLGDFKHFKTLCSKINRLVEDGAYLPHLLWDDFIIKQKQEYPEYVRQCAEEAVDPLCYEKYYLTKPDGPMYMKKVVNPQSLEGAFRKKSQGRVPAGWLQEAGDHNASAVKRQRPKSQPSQFDAGPEQHDGNGNIIDLTADDQGLGFQYAAKSQTLPGSATRNSPAHRSLPWSKEVTHSSSSSRLSSVQDTRTRDGSHYIPARVYDSAVAKQRRQGLYNNGSSTEATLGMQGSDSRDNRDRIRTAWGIPAEVVLGPAYVSIESKGNENSSVMSKDQVELLADIAERTELQNGRALLHAEYRARAPPDGAVVQPKLLDDVLEAVQKKLLEKALDHSRASPELGESIGEGAAAWWQDKNTPFRSFVRSYNSIRPSNGNSFARPEDIERGRKLQRDGEAISKKLNLLNWHI
ncbi:MAG: hypothetical protein Q9163_002215 [Psora crenata]